jgi:hypothetical protein
MAWPRRVPQRDGSRWPGRTFRVSRCCGLGHGQWLGHDMSLHSMARAGQAVPYIAADDAD